VLIIVIDHPERIREFLPQVQELVTEGVITLEEVEVVR
jgi:PII-like signaling protein